MSDAIGNIQSGARQAAADAWAQYYTVLSGYTGSSDDQTALESVMATLGLTADDLSKDLSAVRKVLQLADVIADGQTAVAGMAAARAALEAQVAETQSILAAREAETRQLIATREAARQVLVDALLQLRSDARNGRAVRPDLVNVVNARKELFAGFSMPAALPPFDPV